MASGRMFSHIFAPLDSGLHFHRDAVGNKPWGDASLTAQRDFWNASGIWYPTWGEGDTKGLTVKKASMWTQGACT
jgi:hypothetical protein